jgi:streptogrisin C
MMARPERLARLIRPRVRLLTMGAAVMLAAMLPALPAEAATAGDPVRLAAAVGPPTHRPDPAMLAAMQRDLHLTADGVEQRLGRERAAHGVDKRVRVVAGAGYAGAWLEDNSTVLRVGVVERRLLERVRAAGATPVLVRYRLVDLQAASDRLKTVTFASARLSGWRVDIPTNRVVITHLPGGRQAAEAFAAAGRVTSSMVRYETVPRHATGTADPPFAGRAYDDVQSGGRCTLGFAVKPRFDVLGTKGFVTVGHCGPFLASVRRDTGQPLGFVVASTFSGSPGEPDQAWIQLTTNESPMPVVFGYSRGLIDVLGSQPAFLGESVCRIGSTSFYACGMLKGTGINEHISFTGGATSRVVGGMSSTDICTSPGDSGGPVISALRQAQGVVVGNFPVGRTCASNPKGNSYFQPINPILTAFGLQLLLPEDNPPPLAPEFRITAMACRNSPPGTPTVRCQAAWTGSIDPADAFWSVDPEPANGVIGVNTDPVARRSTMMFTCNTVDVDAEFEYTVKVRVVDANGRMVSKEGLAPCIAPW